MQHAEQAVSPFGSQLRDWRRRRRYSQLDLASEASISQKHLSFIESGRAAPSRAMVLHLAAALEVPLRDRNALLLAAGFAPAYGDRALDDPALAPARESLARLLAAHEPYPALVVDRHWNMVMANRAVMSVFGGIDPALLAPPVNVMRTSLHPRGLAPLIVNLAQWRAHLLDQLRRQALLTGDAAIEALRREVEAYGGPAPPPSPSAPGEVVVPMRLRTVHGVLSLLSTLTVFGTAVDITLAELTLEAFYPADDATSAALRALA